MSRHSNNSSSETHGTPADAAQLRQLRLMQLADSALPVGAAAHSFGLDVLLTCEPAAVLPLAQRYFLF